MSEPSLFGKRQDADTFGQAANAAVLTRPKQDPADLQRSVSFKGAQGLEQLIKQTKEKQQAAAAGQPTTQRSATWGKNHQYRPEAPQGTLDSPTLRPAGKSLLVAQSTSILQPPQGVILSSNSQTQGLTLTLNPMAQPQQTSLFGQQSKPAGTGLFGAPAQPAQPASGGGLFGAQASTSAQPATGGLFGSKPTTAQPAGAGTSLFGQQASAQPKTGGLFGTGGTSATTAQPAASGGLFGKPATAAPATGGGLFGAQASTPAQPATGGLFGASAQPTQPATGGLFGAKPATGQPATGGLFAASAQPSSGLFGAPQPQPTGLFQPTSNQFGNGLPFLTDDQKSKKEVYTLLNQYQQMTNLQSQHNRFRGVVYNSAPQLSEEQKEFLAQNVPVSIEGVPVDLQKWLSAVETNPDKGKMIPFQVSSVEQLKQRTEQTLEAIKKSKERLTKVTDNMNSLQKQCLDDLSSKLKTTQATNQQLINRLAIVFGKMEKLILEQGRANVDKVAQDQLARHQRESIDQLEDPSTGLQKRVNQAMRNIDLVNQLHRQEEMKQAHTSDLWSSSKEQVSDSDLRDILKVLKTQKDGIEVLTNSVRDSARDLMVMEKELDN